jgi:hypothetical protein
MQLDACLRMLDRWAPYSGSITVVYQATTKAFAEAYDMIEPVARVRLVPQGADFKTTVIQEVQSGREHIVFHTDDDLFFAPAPCAPVLPPATAAFSLRLGANTVYCHTLDRQQHVPHTFETGELIAWDWTGADGDFGYPMSLNGHIFHTQLLLRMLKRARFGNPNQLEEELHYRRYLAPRWMLAFRTSSVVSIPANSVSATHVNRVSSDPTTSPEALNERFLYGERIDLSAMDFSAVRGAHQEIALAFTRPGR